MILFDDLQSKSVLKEIVLRIVFNIRNAYRCNNWKLIAKSPISKKSTFRIGVSVS